MILNFPYLHKDEILYSGIARYFDYLNEDRIKWISEQLFSSRMVRASVGFPSGLKNLYDNFPKGSPYSPNFLVDNHSIYPLFRPFIDLPRHEKIINDMLFKDGKGIMTRVGAVASLIPNKRNLYYCASCVKEQMDQGNTEYLDTFWNRVHQCPGVYLCHKHREWLKQTTFTLDEINQHKYVSVGSLNDKLQLSSHISNKENKIENLHARIAESVEWILNNKLLPRDLNYYRLRYIEYLKLKGIAKPSGRVDVLRLKEIFLANYPKDFLRQLHSDFDINDEQTWVQMIIQKNRKAFHPIRHILMIMLLADSVPEFFTQDYTYSPFGSGPWDCNNTVCSKKTELVNISYSRDCKEEFGDFLCKCGFKERRYLSGKRKVLEFGELWEKKLVHLIKEGEGIYPVSRLLNADIETIKKYAQKNNVLDKWLPPRMYISRNKDEENINKVNHYNKWIDTIKDNPKLNKQAIRKLIPATYTWLYRNDKQFLSENSPTSSLQSKNIKSKVDWEIRDIEILETVKVILGNWDKDNTKPKRKTKSSVSKRTKKHHWLEKHPKCFPKTLSYIESEVESVEHFQIRRIKWILNNVFNKKHVREWEIYSEAGLRTNIAERVKIFIKDAVIHHNNKVSKVKHVVKESQDKKVK